MGDTQPWNTAQLAEQITELWDTYPDIKADQQTTGDATTQALIAAGNGAQPLDASEKRAVDQLDTALIGSRGGPSIDLVRAKRKAERDGLPWPPVNYQPGQPWGPEYLPVEYLDRPPATVPPAWRGVQRGSITGLAGFVDLSNGT